VYGPASRGRFRNAVDPHRLHDVVHSAGRHALHVALGHHRGEGPLGPPAGLEEPVGEVAARSQLRDLDLDAAGPGVEVPVPVAVAHVYPLRADFAVAGAAERVGLGRHQRVGEHLDHPGQQVTAAVGLEVLAHQPSSVHLVGDCHRIISLEFLGRFSKVDAVVVASGGPLSPSGQAPRTPRPGTQTMSSPHSRGRRSTQRIRKRTAFIASSRGETALVSSGSLGTTRPVPNCHPALG
jgi:hypothetical protein